MKLPIFCILLAVLNQCHGETFGYKYAETTGQTTYAIVEGKPISIEFDEKESDQTALGSLRALKASVLYFNSEGDKMFLIGDFSRTSKKFVLKHWYIVSPFTVGIEDDMFAVDSKKIRKQQTTLRREDFQKRPWFDPAKKAFDPKKFVKRKRGNT